MSELACPKCGGNVFIPFRDQQQVQPIEARVRKCAECSYVGVMEHGGGQMLPDTNASDWQVQPESAA